MKLRSPRKPQFDPRLVHVRFAVDELALGHVPLRTPRFSPVSTVPPTLHTHLHLLITLT